MCVYVLAKNLPKRGLIGLNFYDVIYTVFLLVVISQSCIKSIPSLLFQH
jgi:hypothetical protein